jgi:MEMO1 family protein
MPAPALRHPAVAGSFYPRGRAALELELDRCLTPGPEPGGVFTSALGCLVPHAGYIFSGAVAGAVYRRLPDRAAYIIMGPNHSGNGAPLALMSRGAWETPLGEAALDPALAGAVAGACPGLVEDAEAHAGEHSLEVQLPFIQRRGQSFSFLPIAVGVGDYETLEALGHAVAEGVKSFTDRPLIVASSDLSHYEPDSVARAKDRKAIDRMLALDARGLYETVLRERISMCGFGPAVALLVAAKELGGTQMDLVRYATSADAGGPRANVVGYAGMVVSQ